MSLNLIEQCYSLPMASKCLLAPPGPVIRHEGGGGADSAAPQAAAAVPADRPGAGAATQGTQTHQRFSDPVCLFGSTRAGDGQPEATASRHRETEQL